MVYKCLLDWPSRYVNQIFCILSHVLVVLSIVEENVLKHPTLWIYFSLHCSQLFAKCILWHYFVTVIYRLCCHCEVSLLDMNIIPRLEVSLASHWDSNYSSCLYCLPGVFSSIIFLSIFLCLCIQSATFISI